MNNTSLIEQMKEIRVKRTTISKKELTENELNNTINSFNEILKNDNLAQSGAYLLLALQAGAVASRKGNNFSIEMDNKKITSEMINTAIKENCPKTTTNRSFARNFGTEIFEISKTNKIEGNIAKKLQNLYPKEWENIQNKDKIYWASDFQGDNENCPLEIRSLIHKQYETLFKRETPNK